MDYTDEVEVFTLQVPLFQMKLCVLQKSLTSNHGQTNNYYTICKGIKVHKTTGILYIYGMREHKEIITEGNYPSVNSRPLTIAKNILKKQLRTGKFKQFVVRNIETLNANKETLNIG